MFFDFVEQREGIIEREIERELVANIEKLLLTVVDMWLKKEILIWEERQMKLRLYKNTYQIARLPFDSEIPKNIDNGEFSNVTKTDDELSILCDESIFLNTEASEGGWRCFKFVESMDLSLFGITARITTILAEAKCNILAESTYNTDFILVKDEQLDNAIKALSESGYEIESY
jgi:hypothetical protein